MNTGKIKNVIFICFLALNFYFSHSAKAQFLEFGAGLGATNVRTDLGGINLMNTRYACNLFFRYNFNEVWVFRLDGKYLHIASNDSYYESELASIRNYNFSNNVIETTANVEFNFLNFRALKFEHRWSPFLTVGLGNYALFNSSFGQGINLLNPCIPFGFGMKYKLTNKLNLGMIFSSTKTFNDKIDGLDVNMPNTISLKLRGDDEATNDWYYYLGISISYTIYKLKCPNYFEDIGIPNYWQKNN